MTEARHTTNNAGIPVASDDHSLTLGANGPILLQDQTRGAIDAHFDGDGCIGADGGRGRHLGDHRALQAS